MLEALLVLSQVHKDLGFFTQIASLNKLVYVPKRMFPLDAE